MVASTSNSVVGSDLVDRVAERLAQPALPAASSVVSTQTPAADIFQALCATAAEAGGVRRALLVLGDSDGECCIAQVGLPSLDHAPPVLARCAAAKDGDVFAFEVGPGNDMASPDVAAAWRHCAGVWITAPDGTQYGVLCVLDAGALVLTPTQRALLGGLARVAAAALAEHERPGVHAPQAPRLDAQADVMVDAHGELVAQATRDGMLSYVNGACANYFGLQPAQMVGQCLQDFVDPADHASVPRYLDTVWLQGRSITTVQRMRPMPGKTDVRWSAWTHSPLKDMSGQVMGMQCVGRDITQQALTDWAQADSDRRFRRLYESTPAVLHAVDRDFRLVTVSDLWLQTLGYTRDEVLGRPSADFMTPASRARSNEVSRPQFLRDGYIYGVELQFVRKDGSIVDMLLSARMERDENGEPQGALAVLDDVSASKQLAAQLNRTSAHLDAIVENIPALLGQWDAQGITRFANRAFQASMGVPLEQIVGHTLESVFAAVDPLAYAAMKPHIDAVLRGQRQDFEMPLLTVAGLRQLRITLIPDQQQAGAVTGYYAMAHDITGRKALELRLTESEARYRSLFDNLNSGFALHELIVDADGRPADFKFLAVNAAFSVMTGVEAPRDIGRRVTELTPGIRLDPSHWVESLGDVALDGVPKHFEQHAVATDRWFEVVAYCPARGQFATLLREITDRKRAEVQLQTAFKEKETLLKEVYHRVKNNLQVVQSLLNLQRRGLMDRPAREALEESVLRVRAMALVHEKLYQSGNLAAVSLGAYAADLLKQIGEANGAVRRQIELVADVADVQTGLDNAIPFGLLVTELVTNALKHGYSHRGGGRVVVRLTPQEGGAALLTVQDDGVGLPEGFDLERSGSMGLQLAANLARQLGGTLSARSAGGASFSAQMTRL